MRFVLGVCSLMPLWSCAAPGQEDDVGSEAPNTPDAEAEPSYADGSTCRRSGEAACFQFVGAETSDVPRFDLLFSAAGLEEWNGEVVRMVVDTDGWGEERYGIAETTIEAGSFSVAMPETLELDYTSIGIYVDTTRDDTCGDGEPVWNSNIGILTGDMTIGSMSAHSSCDINGMFDLAVPLPCCL